MGIHDNFFELGGDSILAIQLVSRMREQGHARASIDALFRRPTIAALARLDEEPHPRLDDTPALVSIDRDAAIPLSSSQQRLWFLYQLDPANIAYNIPLVLELGGSLDVAALAASLRQLVARHETLRTTFPSTRGEPRQRISRDARVPLPVVDVSALDAFIREARLSRDLHDCAAQPLRIDEGPLFHALLWRLGPDRHLLMCVLHHIVTDGWSTGIFARDLSTFYTAHVTGSPRRLPVLPFQYADYASWQQQWLRGAAADADRQYWATQLAALPSDVALPADRPRPPVSSRRAGAHAFHWPRPLREAVHALGRERDATPFMAILAATQCLLYHYSGQTDIIIGTDVATRNHQALEHVAGLFLNQVPLRTSLAHDPTFVALLQRVRETTLAAYAHQELPLEELVKSVKAKRGTEQMPLFRMMLVYHNVPRAEFAFGDLTAVPVDIGLASTRFDLSLQVVDHADGIRGHWLYDRDLFESSTIARLSGELEALIQCGVDHPDWSIDRLLDASMPAAPTLAETGAREATRLLATRRKAVVLPINASVQH